MLTSESRKRKLSISDDLNQSQSFAPIESGVLINLCMNASLETIQKFVSDGGDVNTCDIKGQGPLHIACIFSRLEVVNFLLESGADVKQVDKDGKTAWTFACKLYCNAQEYPPAIILALLAHDISSSVCSQVLTKAVNCEHVELAKLVLSRRAETGNDKLISATLRHACKKSSTDMVKLLLQYGAKVADADAFSKGSNGQSCLISAISANTPNCLEMVTLILDNGTEVYGKPSQLTLPFWKACDTGKGNIKVVKLLLTRGVDINATNSKGCTILLKSSHRGRLDIFKLLLKSGADPNLATVSGITPLIYAAKWGKLNRIKPLLEAGADVTAITNKGKSALDYLQGHFEMIELCKAYIERTRPPLQPLLK